MNKSINTFIYSFLPALFINILFIQIASSFHTIWDYLFIFLITIAIIIIYIRLYQNRNTIHIRHLFLKTLFFIYLIQLLYLLFLSPHYLRDHKELINDSYEQSLMYRLQYETNIIPFQTIKRMIALCYYDQYRHFAFINLLGNLLAFAPLGFFLPIIYPKQRKTYRFVLITALFILFVEILQFFTLSGSMDIDDFILNFFGALFVYFPTKAAIYYLLK